MGVVPGAETHQAKSDKVPLTTHQGTANRKSEEYGGDDDKPNRLHFHEKTKGQEVLDIHNFRFHDITYIPRGFLFTLC